MKAGSAARSIHMASTMSTVKTVRARILLVFVLLLSGANLTRATDAFQMHSPDGAVEFRLLQRQSQLTYSISFHHRPVIEPSPMRIRVDGIDVADGVELGPSRRFRFSRRAGRSLCE